MVITESIQNAIQSAIRKSGSSLSFSRSVGVSHTTVSYWLTGRTRKINSTVWRNLLPLIAEYLDPAESMSYPCSPVAMDGPSVCVLHEQPSPAGWYGAASGRKTSAPLLRLADLADFDPQVDSIEELIRERSKSVASFTSPVMPGYFAVEIDENRRGFFSAGTRILLCWGGVPADGDTVLVKLRDKKEFLFASYARKGNEIVLTPVQGGGRKRAIPKAEIHNVCAWIVSVREAVRLF